MEERERPTTPMPYHEIGTLAMEAAIQVRAESKLYHETLNDAWQDFNSKMTSTGDNWEFSRDTMVHFWDKLVEARHLISDKNSNKLSRLVSDYGTENDDWYTLAAFLAHDIHHLNPQELFSIFITLDAAYFKKDTIVLFNRHKQFLQSVVDQGEWLSSVLALPYEFVAAVMAMEQGMSVPTKRFKPLDIFKNTGIHLQGRFAVDDYELVINQPIDDSRLRNRIIISGSEDLVIDSNEAVIFQDTYNLGKNGAKANANQHHDEKDQALVKAYYQEGELQHPRNIYLSAEQTDENLIFSVADDGLGLSLDESVKRVHHELAQRIAESGREKVLQSEWYWNLKRALGDQAELLIAWPDNPYAFRDVKVGTIFDCQFVAGFSGTAWGIRSFSSGTGLWGVRYMTERLGGTVLGTNKFKGGALFSIILPKNSVGL